MAFPPECDILCNWRACFGVGENVGTFVQGRGYTSYYSKPVLVCTVRHHHGCPLGPEHNVSLRPVPDIPLIIKEIRKEIEEAKCTKKVKSLMYKHLRILEMLLAYIPEQPK